jgi:NTP pyrophosphatase (non-canonical NTP hydrolase)
MCNRPLDKATYFVAGHAIGPVCHKKLFPTAVIGQSKAVFNTQNELFTTGDTMSYAEYELKVINWGTARGIVQNSNPMAQAIKTMEEVTELLEAINKGDKAGQIDAYGDILVTLIMGCATADIDLTECLASAYDMIKNRKGHLDAQGVFHKELEDWTMLDI